MLARDVYSATTALPPSERFGLSAQLRRAAVSVLANIAEGSKRRFPAEYSRFLNVAEGSVAEVECLLLICEDLAFVDSKRADPILFEADKLARMLAALRSKVLQAAVIPKAPNPRP